MSTDRDRARDLVRIGLALAIIALVALSCSDNREPVTEEEKETWDATAFFLAGVFTVSNSSFDDNSVLRENFWANYEWLKDVFLPHVRGTPQHPWMTCPEYCVPAVKKLTKGDEDKEEEINSALAGSHERPESR